MGQTVIAVDGGKSDTKVVALRNGIVVSRFSFPTAIGSITDGRNDLLETHSFSCVFDDGKVDEVLIGNSELSEKPDDASSKNSLINRIVTLYAISLAAYPDETINVAIGCPISQFLDVEIRNKYGMSILPAGKVNSTIDGTAKTFNIERRLVCCEGTAPIYLHPLHFSKKDYSAGIIDIGGLNMNICAINSSNIMTDSPHTSRHGGRMLQRVVQRALFDNDIEIPNEKMTCAIKSGYISFHDMEKKEKSKEIIQNAVNLFVDEIEETLQHSWKYLDTLDQLYFIGGTSYLLKDYLFERFGHQAHFENDLESSMYANADGFARRLYSLIR